MRTAIGCWLSMALGLSAGCATQDWVQAQLAARDGRVEQTVGEQVRAIDARVASLDGAAETATAAVAELSAETRGHRERDQVERERRERTLIARLQAIERAVAEIREVSQVARSRADDALARAEATDARLSRLWANRHARQVVNAFHIRFGFDEASLGDPGKSTLAALAHELRDNPSLSVDLEGWADTRGSRDYNVRLSRRRVEAVQRYLEEQGVERRRINAIARGPIEDPRMSDESKRRVVVRIMVDAE
jgi:outer membrane protein OmpA-like peptidoglycan-associated protein